MGDGPLTRPGASGLMRSLAIESMDQAMITEPQLAEADIALRKYRYGVSADPP